VVGASVLYHLTKRLEDVLLIERRAHLRLDLACGRRMHTLNGTRTSPGCQQYTINLYKELEKISGQSCGLHMPGGIMLAGTRERFDWLKMAKGARPLSRHGARADLGRRAARDSRSSTRSISSARCWIPSRTRGPLRRDARLCEGLRRSASAVVRHTRVTDLKAPATLLDVITGGNVHATRGERRGAVGAQVGRMVGLEATDPRHAAPVSDHEDLPALKGKRSS